MNTPVPMIAVGDQFTGAGGIGFGFAVLTAVTGVFVIALVASIIAYRRIPDPDRDYPASLLALLMFLLSPLILVWIGARPAVHDTSLRATEDLARHETRDDGSYVTWTRDGDEIVYVIDMDAHIATVTGVTHPVLVLDADEYNESSNYVAERLCDTGATMTLDDKAVTCTSADGATSDFRFVSVRVPPSSYESLPRDLNLYYAIEEAS